MIIDFTPQEKLRLSGLSEGLGDILIGDNSLSSLLADKLAGKAPWMVPYRIGGKPMQATRYVHGTQYLSFEDEDNNVWITYDPSAGLIARDAQDTPDFRYDWEVVENDLILYRDGAEYIRYTYEERPVALTPEVIAPASIEEAIGKAADAYATGTSLASKASAADVGLVPTFGEWTFSDVSDGITDIQQPVFIPSEEPSWAVRFDYDGRTRTAGIFSSNEDATNLAFEYSDEGLDLRLTATRSAVAYHMAGQPAKDMATPDGVTKAIADAEAESIRFKEWFPGEEVKSISDCTEDLKYDWENADEVNHTVKVLPFCNTGDSTMDNSDKSGRIVIPPYVNHEGTRYTVVGVAKAESVANLDESLTSIVVPTTVTSIERAAFGGCKSLTAISFPAVVSIGDGAFEGCYALTTISIPLATNIGNFAFDGCALTTISLPFATNIGYGAFSACHSLISISLLAATSIGESAFAGCYSLISISLPAAVSIGDSAFSNCDALTSVSLPSVTNLGGSAFRFCNALTSISLPAATSIGKEAFYNCSALTTVSVPVATSIEEGAFMRCFALTSVSLPAAEAIGENTFADCEVLTSVNFGPNARQAVPPLGEDAFLNVPTTCKIIVPDNQYDEWVAASGWSDLVTAGYQFVRWSDAQPAPKEYVDTSLAGKASAEDVRLTPIYSDTPTFSEWTFSGIPEGWVIQSFNYNDDGTWTLYCQTADDQPWQEIAYGEEDATSLAFEGQPSIFATRTRTDIIGYQLGSQEDKPLASAGDLASLAESIQFKEWFPGGEAKSIDDCTKDLKFDWANADEVNHTVEVFPFCNAEGSSNDNSDISGRVIIPPYTKKNGVRYAVVGVASATGMEGQLNENLTSIVAPTTVTSIGLDAFSYCTALTTVSFPTATNIGRVAFSYCTALTTVSIPAATNIEEQAFSYCDSLATISLPSATNTEDQAFQGCTSLTSVDFGPDARQSIPSLGGEAFPNLSSSGHTCRIIVPDDNYSAWVANSNWVALKSMGYQFTKSGGIYLKDANGIYWELTIGTDGVIGAIAANNLA